VHDVDQPGHGGADLTRLAPQPSRCESGRIKRLLLILGLATALAAAPAASGFPAAGTTPAGEVVLYDTTAPGTILERHAITGLEANESIEGLDMRPANGQLYALGWIASSGAARIYTIDPGTGAATRIGAGPFTPPALTGGAFGFDFNPSADRIRIVSLDDQNLRVNPNNGALVQLDDPLADASGEEFITGVAYDQNVPATTQTTLWGYDLADEHFVRIGGVNGAAPEGSANMGVVTPFASPSGISTTASPELGMDIAAGGEAFVSTQIAVAGTHNLFRVSLSAGSATLLGAFPEQVEDLALLQPSAVGFDSRVNVVEEGAGSATVTVQRSGNASGTQTVAYATADGTATAADYTATAGTLTFLPGETAATFAVPVTADGDDEPLESVALTLSSPTGGAALGTPASGSLTIVDDDPAPPAPDAAAPQLLVSVPAVRRRAQVNKGLRGKIAASEACAVRLTLKLGKRTIGRGTLAPAGPGVTDFAVRPGKAGRKALRKRLRSRRTAGVRVQARGTDAAGNAGTASARLTVRR
jgi:hypothetical protein